MDLCFYHPVGAHSGEQFEEILKRKLEDIESFGFTLWSFSKVTMERAIAWREALSTVNYKCCDVICSGKNTKDPMNVNSSPYWAKEYSYDLINWIKMPSDIMTSYQKFPKDDVSPVASVFIVEDIDTNIYSIKRPDNWFSIKGYGFMKNNFPTRGEFLIERPEKGYDRFVRCTLKIKEPFVGWIR
jgi:hypothetical protein